MSSIPPDNKQEQASDPSDAKRLYFAEKRVQDKCIDYRSECRIIQMVDSAYENFPNLQDSIAAALKTAEEKLRWDNTESRDIPVFDVIRKTTTYSMTKEEMREALLDMLEKSKNGYYGKVDE